jgi:hypothetical protein
MKDQIIYNGNYLLTLIGLFISFIPISVILIRKILWNKYFLTLTLCYVLLILSRLANLLPMGLTAEQRLQLTNTLFLFQPLLVLFFLRFFPEGPKLKKAVVYGLPVYVIMGLLLFLAEQKNVQTGKLVLLNGLLLVLFFSSVLFLRLVKDTIHNKRESGKAMVVSAVFFGYACYTFIFLMNFTSGQRGSDIIILFEISTILSTLLLSAGLWIFRMQVPANDIPKKNKLPVLTEWEEYTGGHSQ